MCTVDSNERLGLNYNGFPADRFVQIILYPVLQIKPIIKKKGGGVSCPRKMLAGVS